MEANGPNAATTTADPITEAGKRLLSASVAAVNLSRIRPVFEDEIAAIEAQAVAAYLASPEFEERLADALTVLPQTDWDPCMADSIDEVAAAIAKAL